MTNPTEQWWFDGDYGDADSTYDEVPATTSSAGLAEMLRKAQGRVDECWAHFDFEECLPAGECACEARDLAAVIRELQTTRRENALLLKVAEAAELCANEDCSGCLTEPPRYSDCDEVECYTYAFREALAKWRSA